jgi:pimeloyl-ACP methyl ester carboxylesterase
MSKTQTTQVAMPELEGVTHRWVTARGVKFHVAEAGAGDPAVLLHGWPQNWWCWRGVIPLLAEHHRVIAIDLRGHGWSDAPPDGYSKQNLADDVIAILDELGLDKVNLIGHDWGGWTGFILALQHPERIKNYIALNIPAPWPPKPSLGGLLGLWRFGYQVAMSIPPLASLILRRTKFVKAGMVGGSVNRDAWTRDDLELFASLMREPDRIRASSSLYRTFLTREMLPYAKGTNNKTRLTVPTLMIHGKRDPVVDYRRLGEWESHADDMAVELRDDSAHFIADELPDVIADRALALFGGMTPQGVLDRAAAKTPA